MKALSKMYLIFWMKSSSVLRLAVNHNLLCLVVERTCITKVQENESFGQLSRIYLIFWVKSSSSSSITTLIKPNCPCRMITTLIKPNCPYRMVKQVWLSLNKLSFCYWVHPIFLLIVGLVAPLFVFSFFVSFIDTALHCKFM